MRILLVYPNAEKELIGYMDLGAVAEPLALEYVAASAKLDGHEVRLLDLRLHPHELDNTLLEYEPEVLGVTGYSMHVLRNLEVCARAKELVPYCVTAVGGHHVTLEPEDFFEPQMDHVFIGEGVRAFREVLRRLESSEPVEGVPGVWARVNGEFQYGGEPPSYDISALPVPDRELAPADRIHYHIDYMQPIALLRTTVGCPYRCSFCSLWRIMDGRYHRRDVSDVVDELASVSEKHVHLADDEPFVNHQRMSEMAECIEAAGIEKEYYAYCRIDTFLKNRDLMARWRKIGLRRLFFGIEAIFDHELDQYNKRQTRDQIVQGLKQAKELDIGIFSNFIIHPEYTEFEFEAIKTFIRENEIEYPSFTIWTPIPGIEDGGTCYDAVIETQPNGRPDWSQFDLQHPVIETTLPKEEFFRLYGSLYEVSPHADAIENYKGKLPSDRVGQSSVNQLDDAEKEAALMITLARKVLSFGGKN